MKLTIEASHESDRVPDQCHLTVCVTHPYDDLTLTQVVDLLIKPALLAFGYDHKQVESIEVME